MECCKSINLELNPALALKQLSDRKPLKVTLVIGWMLFNHKGGAERILCEFANELIRRGHIVTVLCGDRFFGRPAYPIDSRIRIEFFGQNPISIFHRGFLRRVRSWRFNKDIRSCLLKISNVDANSLKLRYSLTHIESDVYIAFSACSAYMLKMAIRNDVPLITMFHSTPEIILAEPLGLSCKNINKNEILNNRAIRKWFGRFLEVVSTSNVIQVLMLDFIKDLQNRLPKANIVYIPNPVVQFKKVAQLKKHKIINIARFVPLKRQHLVVEAFALLSAKFPDWSIEFWGQATNRDYLESVQNTIQRLGLSDRIKICGVTENIESILENASIFIMTSEVEGFGLGMVEAMSKGLPVVGCKDCLAVQNIIRDGENGFLCESKPFDLANALVKLMENEDLRKNLGENARESAKKYTPNVIWNQWERLLYSIISKRG